MKAPADVLEVFLQPGEFYFGDGRTRVRTLLGSCVAVTLWHPRLGVGGMCHYMLPKRPRPRASRAALDGRYAEDAMRLFLREVSHSHTCPGDYQVKLFGGGRMFDAPTRVSPGGIAEANVEYGREAIEACGFTLSAEHLGGRGHRHVMLDLWNGDVWVRHHLPAKAPAGDLA